MPVVKVSVNVDVILAEKITALLKNTAVVLYGNSDTGEVGGRVLKFEIFGIRII